MSIGSQELLLVLLLCTSTVNTMLRNSIIGVPKIECHEDLLSLDIVTDHPFTGSIFVKGKAKDEACMRHFDKNGGNYASYSMQLGRCGMQRLRSANPRGMNFVITVIVSFHPPFVTKYDRAYHVRCFYMEPDEVVSSNLEVSALPTTVLSRQMSMPTCDYSVRRDSPNGPTVAFANIGDLVFHVWACHGSDMGMMVKKCYVTDGRGEDHAVIDYDGCSTDTFLLSDLTYDQSLMKAHAQSTVFKYADSNQLYFTCQIRLCQKQMGLCQGVTPPKCSWFGRNNDSDGHRNSTEKDRSRRSVKEHRFTQVDAIGRETMHMKNENGIDWNNVEIDVISGEITVMDIDKHLNQLPAAISAPSLFESYRLVPPSTQLCLNYGSTMVLLLFIVVSLAFLSTIVIAVIYRNRRAKETAKTFMLHR